MKTKQKIGPVQLLAIKFPKEAKYEGKILKELERLDDINTIRILDLLFVRKEKETSDLIALNIQGEKLGAIVGALMGFEFDGEQKKQKKEMISNEDSFGLTAEAIENIGASLEPGMSAGILLIEHVWAKELKQAIRDQGGIPVAEGFLTPEVIATVAKEIEAITQAMDQLEAEELQNLRAYN